MEAVAAEFGLAAVASSEPPRRSRSRDGASQAPRIGLYPPWTGGNMDEGWTRWVLEQYEFDVDDAPQRGRPRRTAARAGSTSIVLADQIAARHRRRLRRGSHVRPEYRGGIGDDGVENLRRFVARRRHARHARRGRRTWSSIELSAAGAEPEARPAPRPALRAGTILRLQVDPSHPIGYGMARETYGFYNNSPFFTLSKGFDATEADGRRPLSEPATSLASGWLRAKT